MLVVVGCATHSLHFVSRDKREVAAERWLRKRVRRQPSSDDDRGVKRAVDVDVEFVGTSFIRHNERWVPVRRVMKADRRKDQYAQSETGVRVCEAAVCKRECNNKTRHTHPHTHIVRHTDHNHVACCLRTLSGPPTPHPTHPHNTTHTASSYSMLAFLIVSPSGDPRNTVTTKKYLSGQSVL
jgi:hypothetical protein